MSEVVPKISVGKNRVLVSETVYFDSRLPLSVSIPTTEPDQRPGPELSLEFVFNDGSAPEGKRLKIETEKFKIRFLLWEFHKLTAGTTKPIPFKFGGDLGMKGIRKTTFSRGGKKGNVMTPLNWMTGISETILLPTAALNHHNWLGVGCFISAISVGLYYGYMYNYFAKSDPARLQTEEFQLEAHALGLQLGPNAPLTVEVQTGPRSDTIETTTSALIEGPRPRVSTGGFGPQDEEL